MTSQPWSADRWQQRQHNKYTRLAIKARGSNLSAGMSDPKHDRDSDRDSLTDWTLVDRDETPEDTNGDDPHQDEDEDGVEPISPESAAAAEGEIGEEEDGEEESGCGMEEDEDGEEDESLPDDLVSMGQRVQEIKASSGSDSSDIETLECPGPDDFYEDHALAYNSMHSSLLSSSLRSFTFLGDSEEGDIESLASTDISVLDAEKEKLVDEETDLSLISSPSLPDDLPAIKPDTQYRHTRDKDLNSRLNVVVALTLACVIGLGLGHFIGWSSRTVWQESLNSAQVRRLRELQDDLLSCMNTPLEAPSHPVPEFSIDSSHPPVMDQFQAEANPDNLDYQSTPFIPVMSDGDGTLDVESFVESLVTPLEDAGVVLNPNRRKADLSVMHGKPNGPVPTDPTFATPGPMYKPNTASILDVEPIKETQETLHKIPESFMTTNMETLVIGEAEVYSSSHPLSSENVEASSEMEEIESSSESIPSSVTNIFCEKSSSTVEFQQNDQSFPSGCASSHSPEDWFGEVEEDLTTKLPSSVGVEALQIIEALNLENENLESEIFRLQEENIAPIKIHGKDGKYARDLRERINHLIVYNEELRLAVGKLQYASLPDGNSNTFNSALEKNYNLRLAVSKLTHLVPDLNALRVSANDLQAENQELQIQVGKLRYQQQPLPQELNAVARELEKFKKMVVEACQKKKAPPNLDNAKTYISYMSQILSAFQTWHEFGEGNIAEKIDIATDVFEEIVPKTVKLSSPTQEKLNAVRSKFSQIRASIAEKWEKLKEFSQPEKVAAMSRDTLTKMNRVIVNVVNKMKEIGHANIMKRGKAPVEKTINTLRERFTALGSQFDKTWKNLEAEVIVESEVTTEDHDETPVIHMPEKVEVVPEEEAVNIEEDKEQELAEEEEDEVDEVVEEEQVEAEQELEEEEEDGVDEVMEEEQVEAEQELVEEEEEDVDVIMEEVLVETEQEIVEEEEDEGDEIMEEELVEAEAEEEEVQTTFKEEVGVKAETGEDVEVVLNAEAQVEDHESEVPSAAATRPQEEGEGRGGGDGGEEKKLPEDKKNKKNKKIKEKEKEKKEDGKRQRSRRSRISEKEKNKEKREAQKKEKETQKNRKFKEKDNAKLKDKHHGHKEKQDGKQNHNHKNQKNQKLQEKYDNHRYYKGQYNKYNKKHWSDDDDDDDDDYDNGNRKNFKRKYYDDDDDDDDDRKKHMKHGEDGKRKGLMRHWEKPHKKSHHREYSGPKKAFIRRHGKNHTHHHDGEWSSKRAAGREHKRKEELKSDWLFQRARERRNIRESERKADWQFSRAQGRKELRYNDEYQTDKFQDHDKYGHNKYEKHETRRRYVRFNDGDDDDDDDDDDNDDYHYQQERMRDEHGYHKYPKKKGQREWVIPNFSATGKTFHR